MEKNEIEAKNKSDNECLKVTKLIILLTMLNNFMFNELGSIKNVQVH